MDRGSGQQRRDADEVSIRVAVRQNQNVVTFPHGHFGTFAQRIERRLHACGSFFHRIADIECTCAEGASRAILDITDTLQVGVG